MTAVVAALAAAAVLLAWPGSARRGAAVGWRPRRGRRAQPPPVDVAAACDLLALAVASGAGVAEALAAVADVSPAAEAAALRSLVAAESWGVEAALDPAWLPLRRAVELAASAGVPPSGPLRRAAADRRAARAHRIELATGRLRVAVVLPLGLCFLPAFVLTTVVPVVLALATRLAS